MKAPIVAVLLSLASSAPALAATFVYVSNAEDGDIGMYTLQADGSLQPGQRFKADEARDADGGEPGQALPHRRRALQAVPGLQLRHRQEARRAEPRRHRPARRELSRTSRSIAAAAFCSARPMARNQVSVNPVGDGRQGRRAAPGDPDGAQRACDPHRQHEPLRVRAASWHRPGVPVPVRREERAAHREHAAGPAAQARARAAPPRSSRRTTASSTCSTSSPRR